MGGLIEVGRQGVRLRTAVLYMKNRKVKAVEEILPRCFFSLTFLNPGKSFLLPFISALLGLVIYSFHLEEEMCPYP